MQSRMLYDPTRCLISNRRLLDFALNAWFADLTSVPCIGGYEVKKLEHAGIYETLQLLGKYFMLRDPDMNTKSHCDAFVEYLESVGLYGQLHTIVRCIGTKANMMIPGLYNEKEYELDQIHITHDAYDKPCKTLELQQLVRANWECIPEVKIAHAEKLSFHGGICSPIQLIGKYLMLYEWGMDVESHCDAFVEYLMSLGVHAIYASRICRAVATKVDWLVPLHESEVGA